MRATRRWISVALVAGAALAASAAPAQPAQRKPARHVNAEGNVVTGGLQFNPPRTAVRVGQVVEWTNTDPVVPHTATEDHNLWDLTGDYGATPFNPPGFGPGESRSRAFEAGTQHYYCRVHPTQMKGVIAVPVFLSRSAKRSGGRTKFLVIAQWASRTPAAGQVFDVEARRGKNGAWKRLRTGTRSTSMRFDGGAVDTLWYVRARLRRASKKSDATDWSPVISIRA